jgi:hypothetical protein
MSSTGSKEQGGGRAGGSFRGSNDCACPGVLVVITRTLVLECLRISNKYVIRVVSYGRTLLKIRSYCCVNSCFCMIRSTCKIFTLPVVAYFRCFVVSYGAFFRYKRKKCCPPPQFFFEGTLFCGSCFFIKTKIIFDLLRSQPVCFTYPCYSNTTTTMPTSDLSRGADALAGRKTISKTIGNRSNKTTTTWLVRSNSFPESLPTLPYPPGRAPAPAPALQLLGQVSQRASMDSQRTTTSTTPSPSTDADCHGSPNEGSVVGGSNGTQVNFTTVPETP